MTATHDKLEIGEHLKKYLLYVVPEVLLVVLCFIWDVLQGTSSFRLGIEYGVTTLIVMQTIFYAIRRRS